ncbi:MAG: hypothetical protein ACRD3E_00970 [Terriglobales bacterium]
MPPLIFVIRSSVVIGERHSVIDGSKPQLSPPFAARRMSIEHPLITDHRPPNTAFPGITQVLQTPPTLTVTLESVQE